MATRPWFSYALCALALGAAWGLWRIGRSGEAGQPASLNAERPSRSRSSTVLPPVHRDPEHAVDGTSQTGGAVDGTSQTASIEDDRARIGIALSRRYDSASDERDALRRALESSGRTDASWHLEAIRDLDSFRDESSGHVNLHGLTCFAAGCVVEVEASADAYPSIAATLVSTDRRWPGGIVLTAPERNHLDRLVAMLVLLRPDNPGRELE